MFMLVAAVALIAFVSSIGYLALFARHSRRDSLFRPATGRGARRARRVTGMYTRGGEEEKLARQ